jgi:hypothetical protein
LWLRNPEACFRYSASKLHQTTSKTGSLLPLFQLLKAELCFLFYLEKRKSGALKAEVSRHKSGSLLPPNPLKNTLMNPLSLYRSSTVDVDAR